MFIFRRINRLCLIDNMNLSHFLFWEAPTTIMDTSISIAIPSILINGDRVPLILPLWLGDLSLLMSNVLIRDSDFFLIEILIKLFKLKTFILEGPSLVNIRIDSQWGIYVIIWRNCSLIVLRWSIWKALIILNWMNCRQYFVFRIRNVKVKIIVIIIIYRWLLFVILFSRILLP